MKSRTRSTKGQNDMLPEPTCTCNFGAQMSRFVEVQWSAG